MTTEDGPVKLHVLHQFISKYQIDIFAFAKHNTYWDVIPMEPTKGWWENAQWQLSYNCTQSQPTKCQPRAQGFSWLMLSPMSS